jgi:hypothetical protein
MFPNRLSRWTIWRWCVRFGIAHHTTGRFRENTKGNAPHIHEEMPFGTGVLFDLGGDCEALTGADEMSDVPQLAHSYEFAERLSDFSLSTRKQSGSSRVKVLLPRPSVS